MRTLVPYTPLDPKSRLEPILDRDLRTEFAEVMLFDVLDALKAVGASPIVVSPEPIDSVDVPIEIDDRPLSEAVGDRLKPPTAVVMADLALATPASLSGLFASGEPLVLVPGRGGGTNALVVRSHGFEVDFHGISLADHRSIAAEANIQHTELDSFRLSTDIDEPEDLVEVLLHGTGRAPDWLRTNGFELRATEGRVEIVRE